jgi:hypothetical protein
MDSVSLTAFEDEMAKIAGLRELWRRITEFFRPREDRIQRRVDYFFSPKAGKDKWTKLPSQASDPKFVAAFTSNPLADPKLKMHVDSLFALSKGKPVAKIKSTSSPGKTYEIRKLSDGSLGCQCNDWKYRGTVTSGYECRHIHEYLSSEPRASI